MELHQDIHCTHNSESTLDDKIDPSLVRSVEKKVISINVCNGDSSPSQLRLKSERNLFYHGEE